MSAEYQGSLIELLEWAHRMRTESLVPQAIDVDALIVDALAKARRLESRIVGVPSPSAPGHTTWRLVGGPRDGKTFQGMPGHTMTIPVEGGHAVYSGGVTTEVTATYVETLTPEQFAKKFSANRSVRPAGTAKRTRGAFRRLT